MARKQVEEFSGDYFSWLNSFYHVAQLKSFSRAAEAIGRSQSTVTYQINKLEKRLGVELVNRRATPIELTPAGVKLFHLSEQVFMLLYQMKGEVCGAEEISGSIKIVSTYSLASYFFPPLLSRFRQRFPMVSVEVLPVPLAELVRSYYMPDVDLVAGIDTVFPEGAQSYFLLRTPMCLVAPSSWEVGNGGPLRLEDFVSLPFIGFWPDYVLDRNVEECLREKGYTLNIVQHAGFFLPILHYVALRQGVSILDEHVVGRTGMDVRIYPLDHLFPERTYILAHPQRQYLSPAVRALIAFLAEHAEEKEEG